MMMTAVSIHSLSVPPKCPWRGWGAIIEEKKMCLVMQGHCDKACHLHIPSHGFSIATCELQATHTKKSTEIKLDAYWGPPLKQSTIMIMLLFNCLVKSVAWGGRNADEDDFCMFWRWKQRPWDILVWYSRICTHLKALCRSFFFFFLNLVPSIIKI